MSTITLTPTSGPPGTTVTVAGSGFGKRARGTVRFGATAVAQFRTNAHGQFVTTFVAPGTGTVTASTASSTATATFAAVVAEPAPQPTFVWHDEFDGSALSTIWNHEHLRFNYGATSGQQLDNVNLARNAVVGDGTLKLVAVREDYPDGLGGVAHWTSAQINTRGKALVSPNQRLEVRARWQTNSGLRPCLWLSGQDGTVMEIDFPEFFGNTQKNHWAIHWLYTRTVSGSKIRIAPEVPFSSSDWHTFAVEWQTTPHHALRLYQDGVLLYEYGDVTGVKWSSAYPGADPASPVYPQPWTDGRQMFVRLGLQVGGTWGRPIDPTLERAVMEVDWVRVSRL